MAFEAAKREWGELYVFFRLLANGKVSLGTPQARKEDEGCWPITMIQREGYDNIRRYYTEGEDIRVEGKKVGKSLPREDFVTAVDLILNAIKDSPTNEVASPDGVEGLLDEAGTFDLETQTEDCADFLITFWYPEVPLAGFNVRSRLNAMNPLLNGGHTANLKLEQSGVKSAAPTVNKVNVLPRSSAEVAGRIMMIERLGDVLKYLDVTDRVFRCNLLMIDLHFPHVLAEMVRTMHLGDVTRVSELTELMKTVNPLKMKEELISEHGFYEFKMEQFLLALAPGMRPAKIYNGADPAIENILLTDNSGEALYCHKSEKKTSEDFLYLNSRLEKGSVDKDEYGFLERGNGVYYFKLNARVGLIRR